MTTKRNTLFGYRFEKGKISFDPDEMPVVIEIYRLYTERRLSFSEIAKHFNSLGIIYSEGSREWNKAKISHLICDNRYLGEGAYTQLIGRDLFDKANQLRETKQKAPADANLRNVSFAKLRTQVVCGDCGSRMRRRYDKRREINNRWKCTDKECGLSVGIAETGINESVLSILNLFIQYGCIVPETLNESTLVHEKNANSIAEVKRFDSEIARLLDSIDPDKEKLKDLIFEWSTKKYMGLTNDTIAGLLTDGLIQNGPLESLNRSVLNDNVREIRINPDGSIELLLINGTILREDTIYGIDNADARKNYSQNSA